MKAALLLPECSNKPFLPASTALITWKVKEMSPLKGSSHHPCWKGTGETLLHEAAPKHISENPAQASLGNLGVGLDVGWEGQLSHELGCQDW